MRPPITVVPFAVRAFQVGLASSLGLVLATGLSGCGHRRATLRPAYTTPAPAVVAPATVAPVVVAPTAEPGCPTDGTASPTMTTVPASAEPFLNPSSVVPPTSSNLGTGVIRTRGAVASPPAPDIDEPPLTEPSLTPINPTSATSSVPSATINPTGAVAPIRPRSYRGVARPSSNPSRPPRAALIQAVKPFTENVEDLVHPPKADRPWRYVVVHASGHKTGSLDTIDREHRRVLGFEGSGYHFVIGNGTGSPDGQIELADRWLNQRNGVHCQNGRPADVNEYGISIGLVGNFEGAEPTPRQIAAARALVAYLGDRYNIAPERRGTHDQFAAGPAHCPGDHFPTDALFGTDAHVAQR